MEASRSSDFHLDGRPIAIHRRVVWVLFARLCLALSILVGVGACEVLYDDYPVFIEDAGNAAKVVGDPGITLGLYQEQLFSEVADGDDVFIVRGFQGGTWVHISVRVTGMPADGTIALTLDGIGETSYPIKLVTTAEGFLEANDIPIPVQVSDDAWRSLIGTTAQLGATFEAEGKTVSASRSVILRFN